VSTTISPNEHTVVDRSPKLLIGLFLLKYAKRALKFVKHGAHVVSFGTSIAENYSRVIGSTIDDSR